MKAITLRAIKTICLFLFLSIANQAHCLPKTPVIDDKKVVELKQEVDKLKAYNDSIAKELVRIEALKESLSESKKNVYDIYERNFKTLEKMSYAVLTLLAFFLFTVVGGFVGYQKMLNKVKRKAIAEAETEQHNIIEDFKMKIKTKLNEMGLNPEDYDNQFQNLIQSDTKTRRILELDVPEYAERSLTYFVARETDDLLAINKIASKLGSFKAPRINAYACQAILVSEVDTDNQYKIAAKEFLYKMRVSNNIDEKTAAEKVIERLKEMYQINV